MTPIQSGPGVDTPYGKSDDEAAPIVHGLSPDQPIVTNEHGGGQSATPYRLDLMDARSIFSMAEVLAYGAERYGAGNWRLIPVADHLNHLLAHVLAVLAGDESDDHFSHMMCRAMFAHAVARDGVGRNSTQARNEMSEPAAPPSVSDGQDTFLAIQQAVQRALEDTTSGDVSLSSKAARNVMEEVLGWPGTTSASTLRSSSARRAGEDSAPSA